MAWPRGGQSSDSGKKSGETPHMDAVKDLGKRGRKIQKDVEAGKDTGRTKGNRGK